MDFTLTEEQKQLKALIKDFCKREVDINLVWQLSEKAAIAKNTVNVYRQLDVRVQVLKHFLDLLWCSAFTDNVDHHHLTK